MPSNSCVILQSMPEFLRRCFARLNERQKTSLRVGQKTGKILGCTRYDFLIGKYLHRTITAMNRVIQRGNPYGEEKRGTAAANGYAYYGRWQRTNQRKRISEIVRSAAGDSAEVNQPADAGSDQA